MKIRFLAPVAMALAAAGPLSAAVAPETPLIEDKGIQVTALDFEGSLLRLPENLRPQARTSYEAIATILDQIYVNRLMAARARDAGLDKNPVVARRLQQIQEGFLAEQYGQYFDKQAKFPDLDQRASELYKGDPKPYTGVEHTHIQHILVNLWGRTKEMALEKVKQVHAEATGGKEDFLALAKKHSDDPDVKKNGGDLGLNGPGAFEPAINELIAKMKPGEVSAPVETKYGFHVVKFVKRVPPTVLPFASVRNRMVQQERDRILKQRRELLVQELRDTSTVTIYKSNVESLVVPLDPATLRAGSPKQ